MSKMIKQLLNKKPVVSTFDSLSVNSVEPSQIRPAPVLSGNPIPTKTQTSLFVYRDEILLDFKSAILSFFLLLPFYFLLLISCKKSTTDPPPPPEPQIHLSLAGEPYLTEISLKLETQNIQLPQVFTVTRNGAAIFTAILNTPDTTITDTGLFPATTYSYRAYRLANGQKADSSAVLQLNTMDTTGHEFSWEMFTFGDGGSSVLRDIAIISSDNIWTVGEIFIHDSTGQQIRHNAVHWDGQQWELKRIPYIYNGQPYYNPMNFAFSFENGEVWFGGNGIVKWDGNQYANVEITPNAWGAVAINKAWGNSTVNVYIVGNNGSIAHYNGSNWQKIESGTSLPIQDIWGGIDPKTGEEVIYCIASHIYQNQGKKLLKIHNGTVTSLPDEGLPWSLSGVWSMPGRQYFVVGDGIYYKNCLTCPEIWQGGPYIFTPYYSNAVRGNHINDVIIVGSSGDVVHYNGSTWRDYINQTGLNYGNYYRVAIKEDLTCAVGIDVPKAVILLGKRSY